jgi:hypothetical protein
MIKGAAPAGSGSALNRAFLKSASPIKAATMDDPSRASTSIRIVLVRRFRSSTRRQINTHAGRVGFDARSPEFCRFAAPSLQMFQSPTPRDFQ